jgi:hypothetical protein
MGGEAEVLAQAGFGERQSPYRLAICCWLAPRIGAPQSLASPRRETVCLMGEALYRRDSGTVGYPPGSD